MATHNRTRHKSQANGEICGGVLLLFIAEGFMLRGIEPFASWFYSFAWWSYILIVDAPSNPFVGVRGVKKEIWASGLRSPWRFSFDRLTGDLYIGDVGQNSWEEVNHQSAGSPGGENYGWRLMEGNHCFNPASDCDDGTLIPPVVEYDHTLGCSVTGGYVYRGNFIPALFGTYLFGDFCTGVIWGALFDQATGWAATVLHDTNFTISTFGEDEEGELYVADYAAGTIHRIVGVIP